MASFLASVIRFILPTAGPAYASTISTITSLLNYHESRSHPGHEASRASNLVLTWKENRLAQLNIVGLTSVLFANVIAVSFTWPTTERLNENMHSTVVGIWYAALVFALASIATSAHQAVALNRLGSHPAGVSKIRELLGWEVDGVWRARKVELFIWQTPLSLLNSSIIFYAVGLSILVWASVGGEWDWNGIKIVTLFTVALVYSAVLYFWTSFWIYHRIAQSAKDVVRESVEAAVAGPERAAPANGSGLHQ